MYDDAAGPSTSSPSLRQSSRSHSSNFNIRTQCFVCGKGDKKSEKLTPITTGSGKSTRQRVLEAAAKRNDEEIHTRMLTHSDLFAFDAKYHRSCYGHYISDRNIEAACSKAATSDKEQTCHEKAFHVVQNELEKSVLSQKLTVTSLSLLKEKYVQALVDIGVTDAQQYSSWKLKTKLKNYYGNRLIFVQRRGQSDLVCSGNMTIGDAFQQASHMETDEDIEFSDLHSAKDQLDEYQILHMAAAILRSHMSNITDSDNYISSFDLELEECGKFVPDCLYDFLSWCVSKQAFDSVSCFANGDPQTWELKIIAICQNIIAQSRRIRTPISLGLGISVHHLFGSKKLVDHLHDLGYSVSYDEVRRFLSSVALDQKGTDVYIPSGLQSVNDLVMVDAAIDNFDQNEETLDGKSTTHAMAAVLYKRCPIDASKCQVKRVKEKSLSSADALTLDDDIRR